MTTAVDICNRALIAIGSQKVISSLTQDSAEARAFNAIFENTRDGLLRMAPWDCAFYTDNLVYITSVPGTPENTSPATNLWQHGQPAPPWAYEYQYPGDCLRACWVTPQSQTGIDGVPITTAVTGGSPTTLFAQPIRFKVAIDRFYGASAAAVLDSGSGYASGDTVTLVSGPTSSTPIGAPAVLSVGAVGSIGEIQTVSVVTSVRGATIGGSYFAIPTNPIAQGSSSGNGNSASFNLTMVGPDDQRVILTNQQNAILNYIRAVSNPNVWDPLFQDALTDALTADVCMTLKDDKDLANRFIHKANNTIAIARTADGNEGLTINDISPDWLRVRGYGWDNGSPGPYSSFDWGAFLPSYG